MPRWTVDALWARALVAVALIGIATPVAAFSQSHLLGSGSEILLVAVVLAAFFGGFPSAALATVLAALSLDLFVLPPRFQFELLDASHWLHTSAFLIAAILVSLLYAAVRRSERRVHELLEGERESKRHLERLTGQLQDANEVKDEFIGLVSHELKTPLTTIIMDTHYLRRTAAVEGEAAFVLSELESEGMRLASIIDNLLTLARLDRGEELTLEPVAIARIVKRVVLRHQTEHPERPFELQLDPSAIAQASAVSVEQVVQNLISNAEKYSPAGRPVGVRVYRGESTAVVEVADAGPGIPAADVPHVFEPFYRSSETATRVSGIGIGLAVCKRLIEAESGRIWLSTSGEGTTFAFALPLGAGREVPAALPAEDRAASPYGA